MFKNTVTDLLEAGLLERPDLFLIDFSIQTDNHINIVIDGDEGVLVEDCMFISRAIEHNIDRDEHDFSLEVMSCGATAPLVNRRQYKKNLNRVLEVATKSNKFEGKGKVTVKKEADIAYDEIVEAKVMIKF